MGTLERTTRDAPTADIEVDVTLDEWIQALESGHYDKGKGTLMDHYSDYKSASYCCLGVLGNICNLLDGEGRATFPGHIKSQAYLSDGPVIGRDFVLTHKDQIALASINDQAETFGPVVAAVQGFIRRTD